MSKADGVKYAKEIIDKCKKRFGAERVEKALSINVRINDMENYLQKRSKIK